MEDSLYNGLLKYFETLTSSGYNDYSSTSKLLFLIILEEFLTEYSYMVTPEMQIDIDRMKNCIIGSTCLLPLPSRC